MSIFTTALAIAAILPGLLLLAVVAIVALEVFAAPFRRSQKPNAAPEDFRMALLVPAHDESRIIAATIEGYRKQLRADDRLVVVADNCSDDTAERAQAAGAEVIRRHDPEHRGKGYALDFGLRHLEDDAPDAVVLMDADCAVAEGTLADLARRAIETKRPVQSFYDILPPTNASRTTAIASFAHRVKSFLRPSGLSALGGPCNAIGTGIAFPWPTIRAANLASGEIVEDLVLGLEVARDRAPPLFMPEVRIISYFPSAQEALQSQRARWETGHMNVIAKLLPAMMATAFRQKNMPLLAMALDAAVPPLAFVALSLMAYLAIAGLLALTFGITLPLKIAIAAIALFGGAVLFAWYRVGRDLVSLKELLSTPGYVLRKAALYARIALGRGVGWIRTARD